MKTKLFKAAKENLVDDASQAIADSNSTDPAKQISAVDFDAELAALQKKAGIDPEAGNSEFPGGDGGDGGLDTGLDSGLDGGGAEPPAMPEGGEGEPPAEGEPEDPEAPEEPEGEPDEEIGEGGVDGEPEAPVGGEVAVEGILRLIRSLEVLEEQHEVAIVSPELAGVVNGQADSLAQMLDLDLPVAPAMESDTPDGRFANTYKRVKEILAKALEWLKKHWERFAVWIKEVIDNYRSRRGDYPKTLQGFRTRMGTVGEVEPGTTVKLKLGALAHNFNTSTLNEVSRAVELTIGLSDGLGRCVTSVNPADIVSIGSLYAGNTDSGRGKVPVKVRFPSFEKTYRLTTSSNGVISDASVDHKFRMATPEEAGQFMLNKLPGGRRFVWGYGRVGGGGGSISPVLGFDDLNTNLQRFTFSAENDPAANNDLDVEVSVANINLILDLAEKTSSSTVAATALTRSQATLNALQKVTQDLLAVIASDKSIGSTFAQELARAITLWNSAFERAYVLPCLEAVRVNDRASSTLIGFAMQMLREIELKRNPESVEKPKPVKTDKDTDSKDGVAPAPQA